MIGGATRAYLWESCHPSLQRYIGIEGDTRGPAWRRRRVTRRGRRRWVGCHGDFDINPGSALWFSGCIKIDDRKPSLKIRFHQESRNATEIMRLRISLSQLAEKRLKGV